MKKLTLCLAFLAVTACSAPEKKELTYMNVTPRGISALNVRDEEKARVYQAAEKHCAKYSKVPRLLDTTKEEDKFGINFSVMVFECLKPGR